MLDQRKLLQQRAADMGVSSEGELESFLLAPSGDQDATSAPAAEVLVAAAAAAADASAAPVSSGFAFM